MSIFSRTRWRSLSRLDAVALFVLLVCGIVFLARLAGAFIPRTGFLGFLALVAAFYLLIRVGAWLRRHGLWSLRNRLLVAYLFIAVVPVMLLIGMAWLSAYIIYAQFGAHLLQTDLERRVDKVGAIADAVASGLVANGRKAVPGQASGAAEVPGTRSSCSASPWRSSSCASDGRYAPRTAANDGTTMAGCDRIAPAPSAAPTATERDLPNFRPTRTKLGRSADFQSAVSRFGDPHALRSPWGLATGSRRHG